MQILTQHFESSVATVINISPELNTDFECPHSKVKICHKNEQMSIRQIIYSNVIASIREFERCLIAFVFTFVTAKEYWSKNVFFANNVILFNL